MQAAEHELSPRATAAVVVTLVGLSLLPSLHLILHDELEPHDHGAVGHCHGSDCHEHADADARAADTGGTTERESDPADHGAGSLAHHELALAVAPPGIPLPAEARLAPFAFVAQRSTEPPAPVQPAHRARGPPSASV